MRLILERREQDPETSTRVLNEIVRFSANRKRTKISMASAANPRPGLSLAIRLFLLILLFPYFLACTVLSAPTLLLTRLICSRMEDQAFHNSVRYLTTLLVWTLTVLVSFFVLFGLVAWEHALAATLVFISAPLFFYQYYKWFRTARSDFRYGCAHRICARIKNVLSYGYRNPDSGRSPGYPGSPGAACFPYFPALQPALWPCCFCFSRVTATCNGPSCYCGE